MDENIFVFVENIKILSNWIDGWKNECGWNVVNKQMNTVVMMTMMIDFENNGWNSSVHVNLLQYFRYIFFVVMMIMMMTTTKSLPHHYIMAIDI